jgi:hypothetical protein
MVAYAPNDPACAVEARAIAKDYTDSMARPPEWFYRFPKFCFGDCPPGSPPDPGQYRLEWPPDGTPRWVR